MSEVVVPIRNEDYRENMRVYPSINQKILLNRIFGCYRYIYNYFLESKPYNTLDSQLSSIDDIKKNNPWLSETDPVVLEQAVQELDRDYQNYIRRYKKGIKPYQYPRFKSKRSIYQYYITTGEGVNLCDDGIIVPVVGKLQSKSSKPVCRNKIVSVIISRNSTEEYYVSLLK